LLLINANRRPLWEVFGFAAEMQAIWFRVVEMDKFISEKSDDNQSFG
jgi:hypothetical protein